MVITTKSGSESSILSVGVYRPSRLVPNSEIVDAIDSSDEWIVQRTGIESRRFAGPDESVVDMAIGAAEQALARAKLTIKDIDSVIVAEKPKMKPHLIAMRAKLAATLKINPDQVGIKATTNEQLGPVGREEGIAVYAVVLLVKE